MFSRISILFVLLILLLVNLPLHGAALEREPWSELEKGLQLYGVENIIYGTSCFINEGERERLLHLGNGPVERSLPVPPDCSWSIHGGYENSEALIQVRGSDREACIALWRSLERIIGRNAAGSGRSWSVEAYQSSDGDLMTLGTGLLEATGACLRGTYDSPGMVQLLAYLPWAEEGYSLDEGAVNLQLELYRIAGTGKVRIRLGIPVLHSIIF
ncbi:MAG: hypothetical protein GX878_00230 [Firmicutes bacterium]|nr:hypothetical protein [Bacillota bacterium]